MTSFKVLRDTKLKTYINRNKGNPRDFLDCEPCLIRDWGTVDSDTDVSVDSDTEVYRNLLPISISFFLPWLSLQRPTLLLDNDVREPEESLTRNRE